VSATSSFHGAAALLLSEAPVEIVKQVLRLLLDAESPADATTQPNGATAEQQPARRLRRRQKDVSKRHPGSINPEWESLRQQARRAMRERVINYIALGEVLGAAGSSVKVALHRRQPASLPLQAKLKAWLAAPVSAESAEAVTPAPPFRGRRAGTAETRGNGAATTASAA
jgi:hypothetical protein